MLPRTGSPAQVLLWTEDHWDYALVIEQPGERSSRSQKRMSIARAATCGCGSY
jgi:hypothetical protein